MKNLALAGLKNCFSSHAGLALLAVSVSFTLNVAAQTSSKASETYAVASALYRRGDVAGASEELQKYLATAPNDAKARSLLALAFLKTNQRDKARQELARLRELPDGTGYFERLEQLLTKFDVQDQVREALLKRLRDFDRAGAVKVAEESKLSSDQKQILLAWIEAYSGEFAEAKKRAGELPSAISKTVLSGIAANEGIFQNAKCAMQWLNETPHCVAPAFYFNEFWKSLGGNIQIMEQRATQFQLQQISEMLTSAPLDPTTLDSLLLFTLATRPYEEFQSLADKLLKAKGKFEFPFKWPGNYGSKGNVGFERNAYYWLVIDLQQQRISIRREWPTQPYDKELYENSEYKRAFKGLRFEEAPNPVWQLPFSSLKTLKQDIDANSSGIVDARNTIALEFSPSARVRGLPIFFRFNWNVVIARQAMHNLGQYILHLLPADQKVAATLQEVKASGGGVGTAILGASLLAVGGASGVGVALGLGTAIAALSESASANAIAAQTQKASWDVQAANNPFILTQQMSFLEIESILGLAQ